MLTLLLGCALAACGRASAHVGRDVGSSAEWSYRGVVVRPALQKPEFLLTDTSGAGFDFQNETRGRITLLYFGYTHCPDVCPTQMAAIATALKQLKPAAAGRVKVVFVTTDPDRDTAAVLREWLDHFDGRFIGLTGSQSALELVERQAGAQASAKEPGGADGGYAIDHTGSVIVYTPDNLAHLIYPDGISATSWAHDLAKLVEDGWAGG